MSRVSTGALTSRGAVSAGNGRQRAAWLFAKSN
jgi:hypothetical protein